MKTAGSGVGIKNRAGPGAATHLFEKKRCKLPENSDTKI